MTGTQPTTAEAPFGRMLTAMITPMASDGSVDYAGAARLATYLVDEMRNDGLVISGTTGESPTTSNEENDRLLRAVIEAVPEKRVLTDGTHTIELYHVPNNHNEGMLIAYLPKEKILVEADLFTPPAAGAQAPNPPSPYSLSLVENLDRLKLNYEKILPLHGCLTSTVDSVASTGRGA